MKYEIIAAISGHGRTLLTLLGPFDVEANEPLLKAVRDSCVDQFWQWVGEQPETVVVRSVRTGTLGDATVNDPEEGVPYGGI